MQTGTVSGNGVKWLEKEADRVRYFPDISLNLVSVHTFFIRSQWKRWGKKDKRFCVQPEQSTNEAENFKNDMVIQESLIS